jgi:hypothetical protein
MLRNHDLSPSSDRTSPTLGALGSCRERDLGRIHSLRTILNCGRLSTPSVAETLLDVSLDCDPILALWLP